MRHFVYCIYITYGMFVPYNKQMHHMKTRVLNSGSMLAYALLALLTIISIYAAR